MEREFLSEAAAKEKDEAEKATRDAIMNAGTEQLDQVEHEDSEGVKKTFIKCLTAEGLTLAEVLVDLEMAGTINVGDPIAMTGYGGNVWWGGAITGITVHGRKALKTSVAFSGDCSTWSGVLKENQYGQAKITPGGRGKPPTVQRGWIMLGGAKPVRVKETAD